MRAPLDAVNAICQQTALQPRPQSVPGLRFVSHPPSDGPWAPDLLSADHRILNALMQGLSMRSARNSRTAHAAGCKTAKIQYAFVLTYWLRKKQIPDFFRSLNLLASLSKIHLHLECESQISLLMAHQDCLLNRNFLIDA